MRCDSGKSAGDGHLIRSLALADVLHRRGHRTLFITSVLKHETRTKIKNTGHELIEVGPSCTSERELEEIKRLCRTERADWVVTDSYNLDIEWDLRVKQIARSTLVIDDLANRPHVCDLLLDQNIPNSIQARYKTLVNSNCRLLLGPDFLLARDGYFKRKPDKHREGTLVFLGGGENSGLLLKVMNVLESVILPVPLKVLTTSNYKNIKEIKATKNKTHEKQFYSNIDDPIDIYSNVKIAIVRCGFVAYELALLGIPMLIIFETEIQEAISSKLEGLGHGIAIHIKDFSDLDHVSRCIKKLMSFEPSPMNSLLKNGPEMVAEIMELT